MTIKESVRHYLLNMINGLKTDDYYESYKWQKLTTCANYYNYNWGDDTAHDSLADCRATLYCYLQIISNKENINEGNNS